MAHLFGKDVGKSWTQLTATMKVGDTVMKVADQVNWAAGNTVWVTTTSLTHRHTEKFTIASVNGNDITVTTGAQYRHLG